MLYAYRWQIELLFRFLKRTLNGIHLVCHNAEGVTIQFYAILIVSLLQLYLKQQLLENNAATKDVVETKSKKDANKPSGHRKTQPSRFDQADFLKSLGRSVNKYWKIGIHWLTALRDLLVRPFDREAIRILLAST